MTMNMDLNMNTAALALPGSNPQTSSTLSTPATALQPQTQHLAAQQPQPQTQPQFPVGNASQQPQNPAFHPQRIPNTSGPTATAPFLRDFSLVAEAAKRAQVAIVTRDLEGVSL
ncbi:hypothetical protein BJX99DRAFT_252934 [Aspergillus californicus]